MSVTYSNHCHWYSASKSWSSLFRWPFQSTSFTVLECFYIAENL